MSQGVSLRRPGRSAAGGGGGTGPAEQRAIQVEIQVQEGMQGKTLPLKLPTGQAIEVKVPQDAPTGATLRIRVPVPEGVSIPAGTGAASATAQPKSPRGGAAGGRVSTAGVKKGGTPNDKKSERKSPPARARGPLGPTSQPAPLEKPNRLELLMRAEGISMGKSKSTSRLGKSQIEASLVRNAATKAYFVNDSRETEAYGVAIGLKIIADPTDAKKQSGAVGYGGVGEDKQREDGSAGAKGYGGVESDSKSDAPPPSGPAARQVDAKVAMMMKRLGMCKIAKLDSKDVIVLPLDYKPDPFDAWFTGEKRIVSCVVDDMLKQHQESQPSTPPSLSAADLAQKRQDTSVVIFDFPNASPDAGEPTRETGIRKDDRTWFGRSVTRSPSRPFNSHFQDILETVPRSRQAEIKLRDAYKKLSTYMVNELLAEPCRQIVDSYFIPEPLRPQPYPTGLLGLAGGAKHHAFGVMIKFAVDEHGIFGSDIDAAKVAMNEIRHIRAISRELARGAIPHMHVPVSVQMRIWGFPVVLQAIIPISRNTLVYGSDDAATTVKKKSPAFQMLMSEIAEKFNLASHEVQDAKGVVHDLVTGADVEGHHSDIDGRFYLVDLARLFPCWPPRKGSRCDHLVRLFRPEFMQSFCPEKLNADAFSRFGARGQNTDWLASYRAFTHLTTVVAPAAADELVSACQATGQALAREHLSDFLHARGINMRMLGLVYACTMQIRAQRAPEAKAGLDRRSAAALVAKVLFSDMVFRVLKEHGRKALMGTGRGVSKALFGTQERLLQQLRQAAKSSVASAAEVDAYADGGAYSGAGVGPSEARSKNPSESKAFSFESYPSQDIAGFHKILNAERTRMLVLLAQFAFGHCPRSDAYWKAVVLGSLQSKFDVGRQRGVVTQEHLDLALQAMRNELKDDDSLKKAFFEQLGGIKFVTDQGAICNGAVLDWASKNSLPDPANAEACIGWGEAVTKTLSDLKVHVSFTIKCNFNEESSPKGPLGSADRNRDTRRLIQLMELQSKSLGPHHPAIFQSAKKLAQIFHYQKTNAGVLGTEGAAAASVQGEGRPQPMGPGEFRRFLSDIFSEAVAPADFTRLFDADEGKALAKFFADEFLNKDGSVLSEEEAKTCIAEAGYARPRDGAVLDLIQFLKDFSRLAKAAGVLTNSQGLPSVNTASARYAVVKSLQILWLAQGSPKDGFSKQLHDSVYHTASLLCGYFPLAAICASIFLTVRNLMEGSNISTWFNGVLMLSNACDDAGWRAGKLRCLDILMGLVDRYAENGNVSDDMQVFEVKITILNNKANAFWSSDAQHIQKRMELLTKADKLCDAYAKSIQSKIQSDKDIMTAASVSQFSEVESQALQVKLHLASTYGHNGDWDTKVRILTSIRDRVQRQFGDSHRFTVGYLNALGEAWAAQGRFDSALSVLKNAVESSERLGRPNCSALYNLGATYSKMGRHSEAYAALERAVAVSKAHGDSPLTTASYMRRQAQELGQLGRLEEQMGVMQMAIKIHETAGDVASAQYGSMLQNMGIAWQDLGLTEAKFDASRGLINDHPQGIAKLRKGKEYLEQAESVLSQALRPQHPDLATLKTNLGNCIGYLGEKERKIGLLKEALAIQTTAVGADHPGVANVHANMGITYLNMRKLDEAERSLNTAFDIMRSKLGAGHPGTQWVARRLATLNVYRGGQGGRPPEELYAAQIAQLRAMGISDTERVVAALQASQGSVEGAMALLFG